MQLDNEVNVDNKLLLSCRDLVGEIKRHIKTNKSSKEEQLKTIYEFPSAGLLSQFACKAYQTFESDVHVPLPDGWRLLTTASNKDMSNGYFGAAFFNPVQYQMVVAHRGTEVSNVGALVADVAGIVFNNYFAGQLESACTFTSQIVETMKAVEKEDENINFELFFTGHSLGAWLAQITTFSSEFLKKDEKYFTRLGQGDDCAYHAHATVFDSPGGLPMLKKLKSKFDAEDRPIDLCNLNITSYLSAPNQVNTCNDHFGKVYRVFIDTSKMNFMDRNVGYTLTTHSIDNIVKCFEPGKVIQVEEVVDWPIRESITSGQELDKFLKYTDYRNGFRLTEKMKETAKNIKIRYKTKQPDWTVASLNVFTKREQQFLECLRWVREIPETGNVKAFLDDIKTSDEIIENFKTFDIIDQNLCIENPEKMKLFIPKMKLLLKLFPLVAEKARNFIAENKIRAQVFAFETKICLEHVKKDLLDFKPSTIDLSKVFKKQFSRLKVKSGKARSGLSMIYKTFEKSQFKANYEESSILVLNLKRFSIIDELINFKEFITSTQGNFLTILYSDGHQELNESEEECLEKIFDILKQNQQIKVILIGDSDDQMVDFMSKQARTKLEERYYEVEKGLTWNELTPESQEKFLCKTVDFQGNQESIKSLTASTATTLVDDKVLLQIINSDSVAVNFDPLKRCNFSVYTTDHEKVDVNPKHILESLEFGDDIFVITGLYEESIIDVLKSLTEILKPANQKEKSMIECNISHCPDKLDKPGKLQIISLVGSDQCLEDFDEKCRSFCTKNNGKVVHWIKIKEGKLTWRKSYNFNSYINRKLKINSKPADESKLFNQNEKFSVIVGLGGEGKTTFLTHYAKQKLKNSWVIYLNFNSLSYETLKVDKLDIESLAVFITTAAEYQADNHFQNFLLRLKLTTQTEKPIHFVFDGFDEIIADKDRAKALKLLKFIRDQTKCCTTLTSRDSFKAQLNDMQPAFYTFEKLDRVQRENLLKESWRSRFNLAWGQKKCLESFSDDKKSKFQSYVKILLDQLDSTIESKSGSVMGVPQQLKLLADGFQEDFDKYIVPVSIKQKLFDSLKMKTFYNHYLNTKYDIYVTAKVQAACIDQKSKSFFKVFQNISVDSLLPQDAKDLISSKSEYLSPDYIILRLTKNQSPPKVLSIFTGYLLTDPKCESLRTYMNKHEELLPKTAEFEISDEVLKSIVGSPMITVCKEGHDNLLEFLIAALKKKSDLKNVALSCDESGKTALNYAIENCREDCVKLLAEFLMEHGDNKVLKETLQKIDNQVLKNFGMKCKSYAFAEWFQEFLVNNDVKVSF